MLTLKFLLSNFFVIQSYKAITKGFHKCMYMSLMEITQVSLSHTIFHAEYTRNSYVSKLQTATYTRFCISIDMDIIYICIYMAPYIYTWISDGNHWFCKIISNLSSQSIWEKICNDRLYKSISMSTAKHIRITNRTRSLAAIVPGLLVQINAKQKTRKKKQ